MILGPMRTHLLPADFWRFAPHAFSAVEPGAVAFAAVCTGVWLVAASITISVEMSIHAGAQRVISTAIAAIPSDLDSDVLSH